MTRREAKELLPTMKVSADGSDELSISFQEIEVKIISFEDIETTFGKKLIATVSMKDDEKFCIFVNNTSLERLIEAYGDDDEKWIGKTVKLTLEKNEKFKSKMIVLNPKK